MFTMLFILIIGTLFTLFTFYCIWAETDGAPVVFAFWMFLTMLFVLILADFEKLL